MPAMRAAWARIAFWLRYRLHAPKRRGEQLPIFIPWTPLAGQFGASYSTLRNFRRDFMKAATIAKVCMGYGATFYPQQFELDDDGERLIRNRRRSIG